MTSGDEPRSGERRFDAAHVINLGEPHLLPVEQPALQVVGIGQEIAAGGGASGLERSVEQLRAHAMQLADRLQSERDEVDERANQLAAREADLDAKFRNAQQWLDEQRQKLDERALQLESQQAAMAERETALEARATELTHVRVLALAEQEARLERNQP